MGVNVWVLSILILSSIPCPEELYLSLGKMQIIRENNFRQEEQREPRLEGGQVRCVFQAAWLGVQCVRGDACRAEEEQTDGFSD